MKKFGFAITILLTISMSIPFVTNLYNGWKQQQLVKNFEKPKISKPVSIPNQQPGEIKPKIETINPGPKKLVISKPIPKQVYPEELRKIPPVVEEKRVNPEQKSASKPLSYLLEIPVLNLKRVIGEGSSPKILRNSPGHMIESAPYGETGICLIAGHRTTYGAPFRNVDRLVPGDKVIIRNKTISYEYIVQDQYVVNSDFTLDFSSDAKELYLSTCHPPHSAKKRLLIRCRLR